MIRRSTLLAVFSLVVALFAAAPAGARPGDTTTTTAPPPSTTVPPTTVPPTTTIPPETTTTLGPPGDPAAGADGAGEPVAVSDSAVPSLGLYSGQESLAQALAVRGTLKVVEATAIAATEAYKAAQARVTELEAKLASLTRKIDALEVGQAAAVREFADAKAELQERAASAYIRGSLGTDATTLLSSEDPNEYFSRVSLMDSVLASDQDVIERYEALKKQLRSSFVDTAGDLFETKHQLELAHADLDETAKLAAAAAFDLAVFSKGGKISIHGFVFPVDDPHEFVDSYGAPRLTGTANQHWHEGVDIMAPRNTRLFACEHGIITKIGTNELGGLSLWIKGESGTYYYYAHLESFAPHLSVDDEVEPGQLVGFVGNSGDAMGGPTHLHFEIHPDGGPAVDPYPLLKVVEDMRKAGIPLPA